MRLLPRQPLQHVGVIRRRLEVVIREDHRDVPAVRLRHQAIHRRRADTHLNIDKIGEACLDPLLIECDIAGVVRRQAAAFVFRAQRQQQRFTL